MDTRREFLGAIAGTMALPLLARATAAQGNDPVLDILHSTTDGIVGVLKEMEVIGFRSHHARLLAAHCRTGAAAKLEKRITRQLRAAERQRFIEADGLLTPEVQQQLTARGLDLTRPQYQPRKRPTRAERTAAVDGVPMGGFSKRLGAAADALDRAAGQLAYQERGSDAYRIVSVRPGDQMMCDITEANYIAFGAVSFVYGAIPGFQFAYIFYGTIALIFTGWHFYLDCEGQPEPQPEK